MARQSKKQQAVEQVEGEKSRQNAVVTLSADDLGIKKCKGSLDGFSAWVRALQFNWRQGTVACKDRSEVSFSRKKPWKQKGTGRARVGSARSPLWRKGGIIFGPQKRVRTLSMPRRMKLVVKNNALNALLDSKRIYVVDWVLNSDKPKTAAAAKVLKDLKIVGKKVALLLPFQDLLSRASWSNIEKVSVVSFDEINAINLIDNDFLIVFKKDLNLFKEMVSTWH